MTALVGVLCALAIGGCASWNSGIDPSGRTVFANPTCAGAPIYHDAPGPAAFWDGAEVLLYPQETVAPVGTEVILLAGVRGRDQYLLTNQKVEWSIGQGSVGHFVDIGWGTPLDYLVLDFTFPRIVDATRAIGSTSRKYLRLTRGNADPNDDLAVLRGQTWISVVSPQEGTTYVTAFSPDVRNWELHKQSATIHWVDAQWQLPPPAINPAGTSHVFTTTVMKQTVQAPCVGWLVRYEIVGGPPAGFGPDEVRAIEVPTDAAGRASAEIVQTQPAAGTNQVAVQVIRPGGVAGGNGKRLVVGGGCTSKTWSAPGLAVRVTGPAAAAVGATATYKVDVSNPGDLPAQGVVVTSPVPGGLRYQNSSPPGELTGGGVQWRLDALSPGETRSLTVDYRIEQSGTFEICAEAVSAQGISARDCARTNVDVPVVEVDTFVRGKAGVQQPEVAVGDDVTFEIVVTNRGTLPVAGLLIKDRFDPGLVHEVLESPIERDLGVELAPGRSQSIGVVFRVTRPGRLCHTVELLYDGQTLDSAQACVRAVEPERPQPPSSVPQPGMPPGGPPETEPPAAPERLPGAEPGRPAGPAQVRLNVTGPDSRRVGETASFVMKVANIGQQELAGLRIISNYGGSLVPSMATPGFQFEPDDVDSMYWPIPSLPPGESAVFELQARCEVPSPRACNRVTVVSEQGVLAEEEVCLEIRALPIQSPSALSVAVADRMDPVPVGTEVTYLIGVSNDGTSEDRSVSLIVTLPPEMSLVRLGTTGPPAETGFVAEGNVIRFNPVDVIDPGTSLTYRVRARANQAGEVQVTVQLSSERLQQPQVETEDTRLFEE